MHSRSPRMHNHWFSQTGLRGAYLPLAIRPDGIGSALRALPALGFAGCNLTIPHKQTAMAFLDEVDEVSRIIGAVSCVVVRKDGRLFGTNNDWRGFLGNLREAQPLWSAAKGPSVVLGAGGGARAVVYALLQSGVDHIRLVNRGIERAAELAAEFGSQLEVVPWKERSSALDRASLLVNTTSLGMVGQPSLDLSLRDLPVSAVVADIVYAPLETQLIATAKLRGNPVVSGLGMLLHQGPPAWDLWFGVTPKVTPELRRLMEESIRAA